MFFPQNGKLLGSTSHQRRPQHTRQRNILKRIIADLQIIQNRNHLKCGKISRLWSGIHRNSVGRKHLCKGFWPAGGGAKKDYNISVFRRTIFFGFFIKYQLFSHNFLNSVGNSKSLQFPGILSFHQILQFFGILFYQKNFCRKKAFLVSFRKHSSRIKSCGFIVGNSTKICSHNLTENKVCTIQYLRPAAEIFMKIDSLFRTVR